MIMVGGATLVGILTSRDLWVGVKPDAGGAFFELDVRKKRFNLANVLGRHPEGYHAKLREAARAAADPHAPAGDSPRSIHDLAVVKESGLEELLHYDRHLRLGFVDHFLAPGTALDDFARSTYDERGDFAAGAYEVVSTRAGATASVVRGGLACAAIVMSSKPMREMSSGTRNPRLRIAWTAPRAIRSL